MSWLRQIIYRLGARPKPGSIWFSPSLALICVHRDAARASNCEHLLRSREVWRED